MKKIIIILFLITAYSINAYGTTISKKIVKSNSRIATYLFLNRYNDAIQLGKKMIVNKTYNHDTYGLMSIAYYCEDNFMLSKLYAEKDLKLKPDSQEAMFRLAIYYAHYNMYNLSLYYLKEDEKLKNHFPGVWNAIGTIYCVKKEKDKAIKYFIKQQNHNSNYKKYNKCPKQIYF